MKKQDGVTARKQFSEAQKRIIAFHQQYRCPGMRCNGTKILPSTWQLDHIIPLHLGGSNYYNFDFRNQDEYNQNNLHILCAGCHALKTQQEMIQFYVSERTIKYGNHLPTHPNAYIIRSPYFTPGHPKYIE